MQKIAIITAMFFLLTGSYTVFGAEGGTGWRNLTGFGCHLSDGTCYIDIDGPAVGASTCLGNNVRFNILNSPNGKTWLSMLEIAYVANKRISININECYSNQPAYPTFNYGRLEK